MENAMEVEDAELEQPHEEIFQNELLPNLAPTPQEDLYNVVVVENPAVQDVEHVITQIVYDNDAEVEVVSSTESAGSSRAPSPALTIADEESRQSCEEESKKRPLIDSEDEDDGKLCPICLDNWTSTGDHRICSLKCGHLFGHKCVQRWLASQSKKSCPTCKKKVNRNDIRFIYAKRLIAMDTTELDILQKQLNATVEEKNKLQLELTKKTCLEHSLTSEIEQLKKQIQFLSSNNPSRQSSLSQTLSQSSSTVKFYMEKSVEICQQSGCRVFDVNHSMDTILATCKSPSSLFTGFGLRKVQISTFKPTAIITLHNQPIRDITFKNNSVLTASMDKSFKILDGVTNTIVHTGVHDMPLWSCAWDATHAHNIYIGTQTGAVHKYDLRGSLSEPITSYVVPGDMSPVVGVASIASEPGQFPYGSVVSCKLNSVWCFEDPLSEPTGHKLSLDGPFYCLKYQQSTKQLLVSSRPNMRHNYSRHTLSLLHRTDSKIDVNVVHTFAGAGQQKFMSRSCFLSSDGNDFIAAHEESSKSIQLWSINNGSKAGSVHVNDTVLDMCWVSSQNNKFLVALTEKKLEFFKLNT